MNKEYMYACALVRAGRAVLGAQAPGLALVHEVRGTSMSLDVTPRGESIVPGYSFQRTANFYHFK